MLHDTVRLAQPNRNAKEAAAQKEAAEFVVRPFDQVGRDVSRTGFFVNGEEACERWSECMYQYMID
jgi:hypothetical protein